MGKAGNQKAVKLTLRTIFSSQQNLHNVGSKKWFVNLRIQSPADGTSRLATYVARFRSLREALRAFGAHAVDL